MNQQPTGYPQYPPPQPQQFSYQPYPPQQQTQYTYPAPQQPPQQYQPLNQQQAQAQAQVQQQPPPSFFHPYPTADTLRSQQAPLPQSHTQPQTQVRSRRQRASPPRQNGQQIGNEPAGLVSLSLPRTSPDLEDQLRNALQPVNNGHADNEQNDDDNDADDDDDGNGGDANADGENEPVFNLPPPPEGNYASEQELENSIHAWSLKHGYEMVRRASKKNAAGVIYKRYYHCSKHGKLANTGKLTEQTRVRARRKSNRMGCPMSLAAVAMDPSNPAGQWQIRHRKTHHNHGPLDALALAGHRRRARMGGVEKAVDGLFAIGTPTSQVLTFLQRTNPDGLFTRTDVANMKLKWKKYGTCQHLPNQYSKDPEKVAGLPSACMECRVRKTRCDSTRPICGTCMQSGARCEYDHEPVQVPSNQPPDGMSSPLGPPAQQDDAIGSTTVVPAAAQPSTGRQSTTRAQQNREQASQILAELQQFQNEHVKPKPLELNSSSVEILAHSSCGNGDSYKNVHTLVVTSDWQAYADAFLEASLKENTHDVLIGNKLEPVRPEGRPPGEVTVRTGIGGPSSNSEDEIDVETWNEYIKQLAIFNRRNQALLGALWGSLAPSFRTRVRGFQKASEAWSSLEEMCRPRGSEQAWNLYCELYSTTLANTLSGSVQEYAGRLETKYAEFCRLKLSIQHPHDRLGHYHPGMLNRHNSQNIKQSGTGTGADIVSEEALCFLFLRGLGERWQRWVETLCQTSNVGGFGTGFKLGFRDLVKKAVDTEGMRRVGGNANGGT